MRIKHWGRALTPPLTRATAFADGFVNTVGNVVGAKDLAVLQGTFRKSGERAAARLGTEFLEQGGKAFVKAEAKELAGKGMSTILQEALANGVDKFDQKIVRELAEQMVKAEVKGPLREQALAQLTKEITQQLEQQLLLDGKTVFKQMLRESLLNMEGGALGGLGSGAVHWNPNASVSENIQQALVSTATGAGMAAAFTVGMRAAAYSFDAISSRAILSRRFNCREDAWSRNARYRCRKSSDCCPREDSHSAGYRRRNSGSKGFDNLPPCRWRDGTTPGRQTDNLPLQDRRDTNVGCSGATN